MTDDRPQTLKLIAQYYFLNFEKGRFNDEANRKRTELRLTDGEVKDVARQLNDTFNEKKHRSLDRGLVGMPRSLALVSIPRLLANYCVQDFDFCVEDFEFLEHHNCTVPGPAAWVRPRALISLGMQCKAFVRPLPCFKPHSALRIMVK